MRVARTLTVGVLMSLAVATLTSCALFVPVVDELSQHGPVNDRPSSTDPMAGRSSSPARAGRGMTTSGWMASPPLNSRRAG